MGGGVRKICSRHALPCTPSLTQQFW
jgi:hypothetical protein